MRRSARLSVIVGIVAALLLSAAPAAADTLTISGKVTSTAGGPVPNACITVGVPGNTCWTTTNADGDFLIDLAPLGVPSGMAWEIFFIKAGYTTNSQKVTVDGAETLNISLTPDGTPISTTPPPTCGIPEVPGCSRNAPPPSSSTPTPTPTPTLTVEERIALFWQRVDALLPTDHLTAGDLGQWALNIIERDPSAKISVADFRASTAGMQAALDRARIGAAPGSGTAEVEERIALFWQRVDALGPTDHLTAADLGQWALNVTDRDTAARIRVDEFRASTAGMQAALDRARVSAP